MSKKYTVTHFIKKFSAIPSSKWTTGVWFNADSGRCCALGHCGVRTSRSTTGEAEALRSIFTNYFPNGLWVTIINDYPSNKFPQKTPRGRILAALEYIKSL